MPLENTTEPKVSWCFQGVHNENMGQIWVEFKLTINTSVAKLEPK